MTTRPRGWAQIDAALEAIVALEENGLARPANNAITPPLLTKLAHQATKKRPDQETIAAASTERHEAQRRSSLYRF